MYPKKLVKKARKLGYEWLATDQDGTVNAYEKIPRFSRPDMEWLTHDRYASVGTIDISDWTGSLYEIPPKPIYPKWVIKAAKHCGCKWIATNKSGAVYGYTTKPVVDGSQQTWGSTHLVSSKHPLNLPVDWTESLYEVPQ